MVRDVARVLRAFCALIFLSFEFGALIVSKSKNVTHEVLSSLFCFTHPSLPK